MDIVSELTARAASYVLVLQDAWALPPGPADEVPTLLSPLPTPTPWGHHVSALYDRVFATPLLRIKALALAASTSRLSGVPAPTTEAAQRAAFEQYAWSLLHFLQAHLTDTLLRRAVGVGATATGEASNRALLALWHSTLEAVATLLAPASSAEPLPPLTKHRYLSPEQWRRMLRVVLYQTPARRVELAEALDYLPTLVYNLLHAPDSASEPPLLTWQEYVQLPDCKLADALNRAGCPVPFEVVFDKELGEITAHRRASGLPATEHDDPLQQADGLQLCALAFSGGGIRSATFNLGLLQGLAGAGWLRHFDYLSTVSGGGYLGAWLVAWIKREGSLQKVVDRLAPAKSPTPNAEEVRPIRWLRMYSNYLAPNASFFSTDAWTIGVTWLRNTLLNQLILVLALGAALALGSALLHFWMHPTHEGLPVRPPAGWVAGVCTLLLLPGTWLSGMGMRTFKPPLPTIPSSWPARLVGALLLWAFVGAGLASWFFYHYSYTSFSLAFGFLWPVTAVAVVGLLAVAIVGRYDLCFYRYGEGRVLSGWEAGRAWVFIGGASVVAALIGQCGLAGVWGLLDFLRAQWVAVSELPTASSLGEHLRLPLLYYGAFILGPPLVLEVVALTVVMRMALLGANFPDERREWWGRLGAALHLLLVAWVLLVGGVLLAREVALLLAEAHLDVALTGGWLALVGKAVQLAFSARTPAQPAAQPGQRSWLDYALPLAPYLFGLGLLILTSNALHWLVFKWPDHIIRAVDEPWVSRFFYPAATELEGTLAKWSLLLGVGLGLLAAGLGWRVGVNEFSLHHFYRNRLVRAYLGASRLRYERERTANPFTSFDSRDDVKLCSLQQQDPLRQPDQPGGPLPPVPPYDGPYLLINATLNATKVTNLAQQTRQAESFVFTPLYCGFDFARVRAVNPARPTYEFGYRPTVDYAYAHDHGPGLGTAMAISGAAANPNEGYHSSPATAFLLTLFNVRLGWWIGNPSRGSWQRADPQLGLLYLLFDLLGRSDTSNQFVNLSDGGHFDNMGLYELVRRRCRYIVLGDGEEDHLFTCQGLANAIRRCRVDFGTEIALDVTPITNRQAGYSRRHYAVGTICYPDDAPGQPSGYLLYLKASLTGDEPADVREYAQYNQLFPHQSTSDQFFDEAQFESYRRLGLHLFETLAQDCPLALVPGNDLESVFRQLLAASTKPTSAERGAARPLRRAAPARPPAR